ncbi:hypothetical protein N0V84_006674 [Fusarium piperis]|uniref:Uncharacterized protein n=1 Tax=Fusarium piperis TaxID=1435070 RepID=A0A9W8WBC7_9HYPO|nr:hypothetical protein N0V84_006674 [Fusarium piperis]
MLASFALITIARALGETSEQGRPPDVVCIQSSSRLSRTIQRFETLWKDWVVCARVQYRNRQHPELDQLFIRAFRVMAYSSILICDIKMVMRRKAKVKVPSDRLVKIMKTARKAIISGQRITHLDQMQSWVLPEKPPPETPASDASVLEYERRMRLNEKADTLVQRRKKPVQCCMFVALVLYQHLCEGGFNEFVAEYEDEVVRDTFSRAISIDDAKTYESLQLKNHCRARLTPPQDKIPKKGIPFGEFTCIPRFVRNPMACGAPVVTNQFRLEKDERDFINLNRNNRPQHIRPAASSDGSSVNPRDSIES